MSLVIGREYHVTTISGVTSIRTFLGTTKNGITLFQGHSNDGRVFENELKGSDMFVISIQPVEGIAA